MLKTIGVLSCGLSVMMLIISVPVRAYPQSFAGCAGTADEYGPCSDTGATTTTGGGTFCGSCSTLTVTFAEAGCGGVEPPNGYGVKDCIDCTVSPKSVSQAHANVSVGSIMYAACYASYLSCQVGQTAGCTAGCLTVCPTTGPYVAACIASCEAACVGVAGNDFCNCTFQGCANDCLPSGPVTMAGDVTRC